MAKDTDVLGMLSNPIGTAINTALGLATADWADRRQLEQQQKLQALQIQGQQQLGRFNQGLALEMWDKTNYAAQVAQLKKAGLNVGLMYKGAGQGGTTQGGQAGGISGASAPVGGGELGMAMQLGMATQRQEAEIENIRANTAKTKADTAKTTGVDTDQVQATIDQIRQGITNAKTLNEIAEYEKQIKQVEANIAQSTQNDIISKINKEAEILLQQLNIAKNESIISDETFNQKIKQVQQDTEEQKARISALKEGIKLTQAQTKQMAETILKTKAEVEIIGKQKEWGDKEIQNKQRQTVIQAKEQMQRQLMTEFATSDPQKIKQWLEIYWNTISIGGKLGTLTQ